MVGLCKFTDVGRSLPVSGRDLALLDELNQVNGRRVSPLLAWPAFQRGFKFPDRRGSRPTTVHLLENTQSFTPVPYW